MSLSAILQKKALLADHIVHSRHCSGNAELLKSSFITRERGDGRMPVISIFQGPNPCQCRCDALYKVQNLLFLQSAAHHLQSYRGTIENLGIINTPVSKSAIELIEHAYTFPILSCPRH
jgi:hypothetical protein